MIGAKVVRPLTVLGALALLYVRIPTNFTQPQFWGEDGFIFFNGARAVGWDSLFAPTAGYFAVFQQFVANIATYFPVSMAPTIYNYTAIGLALFTVWLVTSPRLDLPFKPLLALAIVVVPMGFEVLGSLANTQWIFPIAALLVLLLKPSQSRFVFGCEIVFMAMASVTGPFVLFLLPICVFLAYFAPDRVARDRLIFLAVVLVPGFALAILNLIASRDGATNPPGIPLARSPWFLWLMIPVSKVSSAFGLGGIMRNSIGVYTGIVALALLFGFAIAQPYRPQKIAMLCLGLAITFSGMLKYRNNLTFLLDPGTTRYFYAASVLFLWSLCLAAPQKSLRVGGALLVAAVEIYCVVATFNTPRERMNFEWPVWTRAMARQMPLTIPITPYGFFVTYTPSEPSPMASWVGQTLPRHNTSTKDAQCSGKIEESKTFIAIMDAVPRWIARGEAWDIRNDKPFEQIALVDESDRVVGFAQTGFSGHSENGHHSGWIGIFPTDGLHVTGGYGITADGQFVCLAGVT